ncbi:MAG TPA: glycosyltransferase family 2 protein [bacterium]|nr:glycosyltransferase family 2 protein [bacterium]
MPPFITVIMPIRNEEAYIGKALESIREQDYPSDRYEVLIVDGMSNDRTRQIVEEEMRTLPQARLLDNPHRIVPHALNLGLANSRGDVILRVDGHVVLERNYFSLCIAYLQSQPDAACVGGVIASVNTTFIGEAIALAMASPFGVGNSYFRTRGPGDPEGFVDSVAFGAYRREVFDQIGVFDEELVRCQDDEFNYRLRKHGGKIFLTPRIRSTYYSRTRLGLLWRQYFQYGLWKIRVLQKHLTMMQLRQFVPPVFVLSLFGSLALAPVWRPARIAAACIVGAYLAASAAFAVRVGRKKGFRFTAVLPIIFLILHLSYGLGFLYGMIKFMPRSVAAQLKRLR